MLGCALGMIMGCSGDRVVVPGAESSSGEPSGGTTTTNDSSSTSLASSTSTGSVDDGTGTGTGAASTGEPEVIFLPELDLGSLSFECDIFAQDCPPDEKCIPWESHNGGSWNAWGCKPLADDPVGIDEVCHVEGSYYSGIDDCERGAMCWDVDPKTNQGTCIPLCTGSEDTPVCDDPERRCQVASDSILWLCGPVCDPLEQDCPAGQACYPYYTGSDWFCAPDASGDSGSYGDGCEYINVCNPGLVCLDESTVPPGQPCEGSGGCCTEVCDLADSLGDMQCAGAAEGQTCQPWFEEGEAPPGYEEVGVCVLPR